MTDRSDILNHFANADPTLFPYMQAAVTELELKVAPEDKYFYTLCRAIAGQQLSIKAAATIWRRVENLLGGIEELSPQHILDLSIEQLRECGLSRAKANYIHNIAQAYIDDANYSELEHLSDQEVIDLLTKIKGVGKWTAEMFLMFTLGREDVFSSGDLGLIKGMMQIYGMKTKPSPKRIAQITKKWSPYKTYASITLWSVLDNKPR